MVQQYYVFTVDISSRRGGGGGGEGGVNDWTVVGGRVLLGKYEIFTLI